MTFLICHMSHVRRCGKTICDLSDVVCCRCALVAPAGFPGGFHVVLPAGAWNRGISSMRPCAQTSGFIVQGCCAPKLHSQMPWRLQETRSLETMVGTRSATAISLQRFILIPFGLSKPIRQIGSSKSIFWL